MYYTVSSGKQKPNLHVLVYDFGYALFNTRSCPSVVDRFFKG